MENSKYKFRAWDKNERTMHPVSSLSPKFIMVPKSPNQRSRNDCDIMQYTGLKDRNGVEIFEGDVVRGEFIAYDIGVCTGQILFDEARFIFKSDSQPNYPNTPVWVPLCEMKNVEIIGNVHQHPHLLGEKK